MMLRYVIIIAVVPAGVRQRTVPGSGRRTGLRVVSPGFVSEGFTPNNWVIEYRDTDRRKLENHDTL